VAAYLKAAKKALKTSDREAIRRAALDAIEGYVRQQQESACELVDRLISLTEIKESVPVQHAKPRRAANATK
jgi:hypothetical protein